MKSIVGFKKGLAKIRNDWQAQRFDQALDEVNRLLETYPDHPKLLVMRANLIPLQADTKGLPTLEDARNDLTRALAFDDESPEAVIELGYFFYAFDNNSKEAVKYFDKAIHLCVDLLTQALVGHAEALSELGREPKARHSLMEACSLAAQHGDSVREEVFERIKDLLESSREAEPASHNGTP